MRRALGVGFGLATHLLFAVTVVYLFQFLDGHPLSHSTGGRGIDLLLSLQFAIPHSMLLHPSFRKRLGKWIPREFYGLFFCCVTCGSLWIDFLFWRTDSVVLWSCQGGLALFMRMGFYSSWVALFYSLALSGIGYQTGWTPWWHWVRGTAQPVRRFEERGAYRWMRHPIYLSFLGLLWFTPTITVDRAILLSVWTSYIFVGSCLKDRRLLFFLGETYREYQSRVPGYPGMLLGPLGRVRAEGHTAAAIQPTSANIVPRHAA